MTPWYESVAFELVLIPSVGIGLVILFNVLRNRSSVRAARSVPYRDSRAAPVITILVGIGAGAFFGLIGGDILSSSVTNLVAGLVLGLILALVVCLTKIGGVGAMLLGLPLGATAGVILGWLLLSQGFSTRYAALLFGLAVPYEGVTGLLIGAAVGVASGRPET